MTDRTFLIVAFIICLMIAILGFVGMFVTSPVLGIFAAVFTPATALIARELWETR